MRRMIEIPRPELDTKPLYQQIPKKSSFFLIKSGQIMRFFFMLVLKFSGSRSDVVLVFNMMSEMALIVCSFIICLNDLIKRMSLIDLLAES